MNKRIKKKIEKRKRFIKKLSKRERDELKLRSYIHTRLSETIGIFDTLYRYTSSLY